MWHVETDFFALAIFLLMFKRKKRPEPTFTNPFTGLFFKLSENIEYERGIFFMPVGVGMIMLYSVIGLLMVIFYRKKLVPKTNVALMSAFFPVTAVFIWVQLANPGWLIINASYAMDGTISVKSKPNEGTEFIVELYLPVCERYIKIPSGQQP